MGLFGRPLLKGPFSDPTYHRTLPPANFLASLAPPGFFFTPDFGRYKPPKNRFLGPKNRFSDPPPKIDFFDQKIDFLTPRQKIDFLIYFIDKKIDFFDPKNRFFDPPKKIDFFIFLKKKSIFKKSIFFFLKKNIEAIWWPGFLMEGSEPA